ncbi:unnamed protein product [Polarella glacialis]|uniref:Uncharacterized protein n=1 Tax=Polarella glacialis TaxID=89957 RepID=A0A813E3V9_POLGL|nr:unnamed protein product [Polarella glacialis]
MHLLAPSVRSALPANTALLHQARQGKHRTTRESASLCHDCRARSRAAHFCIGAIGSLTARSASSATSLPAGHARSASEKRQARRWPTGHRVVLRHTVSGHIFEFLVEKRGEAVLLSARASPFERLALPKAIPERVNVLAGAGAHSGALAEPMEPRIAMSRGTDKDWQLLWRVSSQAEEATDQVSRRSGGNNSVEICSATRPDLLLSASPQGGLLVRQHIDSLSSTRELFTFQELSCEEPETMPRPVWHRQASPNSDIADRESANASCTVGQSETGSHLLSEQQLRDFALDGFVVVRDAVPAFLWQPASALVHSELGRPGGIISGGSPSNSGFEELGKLQGGICNRAQFQQLLMHPRSGAGTCAAQLLGVRSVGAALGKQPQQLPCQVALRFPDPLLAEAEATKSAGGVPLLRSQRIYPGTRMAATRGNAAAIRSVCLSAWLSPTASTTSGRRMRHPRAKTF